MPLNQSLDYALISRMLSDNLALAQRMLEIGNLVMAQSALEMCHRQVLQLRSLAPSDQADQPAVSEPLTIEA